MVQVQFACRTRRAAAWRPRRHGSVPSQVPALHFTCVAGSRSVVAGTCWQGSDGPGALLPSIPLPAGPLPLSCRAEPRHLPSDVARPSFASRPLGFARGDKRVAFRLWHVRTSAGTACGQENRRARRRGPNPPFDTDHRSPTCRPARGGVHSGQVVRTMSSDVRLSGYSSWSKLEKAVPTTNSGRPRAHTKSAWRSNAKT